MLRRAVLYIIRGLQGFIRCKTSFGRPQISDPSGKFRYLGRVDFNVLKEQLVLLKHPELIADNVGMPMLFMAKAPKGIGHRGLGLICLSKPGIESLNFSFKLFKTFQSQTKIHVVSIISYDCENLHNRS